MPLNVIKPVVRRWFEGAPRRPIRTRRPHQPLGVERLEDRTTPANFVESGGLRFVSNAGFTQPGNEHVASSGLVSIGYVPAKSGDFLALVQVDLGKGIVAGELAVNTGGASFGITNGKMALTVVNAGKSSPPIPIWDTPSATKRVDFSIPALTGIGVTLSDAKSSPIEVASVDFTLSKLGFANPGGGDTSDSKVQMQGNVTFDRLPVTNVFNGVKFEVNGANYVVADKKSITLTGIEASAKIPSDSTIGGMNVSGNATVSYSNAKHLFTVGGGIQLSSNPQDKSGKVGFNNVGAELNVTLQAANKHLDIQKLGFRLDESFKLFGLTVSTLPGLPFGFEYNFDKSQFELSGGLQAEFRGNKVGVSFGNIANPGLIIVGGEVTELHAKALANFQLFGAKVSTDAGGGLNFAYDRKNEQFEMFGGLTLSVPTTNTNTQITARMGTGADDPGLVIVDGELKDLNLALSGQFDVYGLALGVNNGGVKWARGKTPADDTLEISGDYTADFKVFQTDLQLGGTDKKGHTLPGITIADGRFSVGAVSFELTNADLGPVTLNDLKVSYAAVGNSFDLDVEVVVSLPGGWRVGGGFEFVNGKFDSISLAFQDTEGIAIGDTGLFLTEIAASVKNIENPSQIVVSGRMDVVFGETINMLGRDVNLFHAEGQFTVDANQLVLDCDVQLGAYTTDNGNTWRAVLGQADGKLSLDWHDNIYSLHVEADGLFAIFDVVGDIVFAAGKDIRLLATATVVVPHWVPFIGGDTLGGFGFYFEHTWPQQNVASSTTLAAWIDLDIIWPFTVGFELFFDGDGNEHTKLIGGGTVNEFKQSFSQNDQLYTFSTDVSDQIPAAATSAVLSADWKRSVAGVTILERPKLRVQRTLDGNTQTFTEDQFAANGISLISDSRFNGPTSAAVQIVGSATDPDAPITGNYTLLVDVKAEDGNPFPSFPDPNPTPGQDYLDVQVTYHIPNPTFGPIGSVTPSAPQLTTTSPAGTFTATVTGSIDEAYLSKATVNLYRVRVDDPFRRGVLAGTSKLIPITPAGGMNWTATFDVPIDGLDQTGYTLYAVLNDGFSTPKPGETDNTAAPGRAIQSANSAQFTPVFAVVGHVLNQNNDPEFGWDVYLDYNQNGSHEANEPIVKTNREGVATFTRAFDSSTGWDSVPVGKQFLVQLVVPPQAHNFGPFPTSYPLTYGGTTWNVRFTPKEKSAIKGNVFVDLLNDGNAAHGRGAAGAVVYIDTNGSGRRDRGDLTAVANAAGDYAFANVAPGKYKVELDLTSLSLTTPTAAYVVPAGTPGNQSDNYTYGMEFDVNKPTVVTSLGVFDSKGDGFGGTMTVVLYDATTKAVVVRQNFTPWAPGTLQGGTRFLPLASPITLMPGFRGIIAVYGVTNKDPVANNNYLHPKSPPPWKNNAGNGQLTFLTAIFAATPNTVPNLIDDSPYPNTYAAGTFLFREAPWASTSPGARPYTITVGNSGFDLREGKDFGVLPPSFVAGNVRGHPLVNGQPQPGTNPLAGWTVQLLTDSPVTRIHAGGGAVGNYVADTGAAGGTTSVTAAEIDTSRVFNPAPQEVYQICRFGPNATNFSYTIPAQSPGAALGVRLHFAEPHWGAPGERQFNVTINGQRVLSNLDVFQAAGGINTAVVRSFDTVADASGNVVIEFTPGAIGDPFVNGIEIFRPGTVVATTTTDAQGNYVFTQHAPGNYTVQEVAPAGWRQVSPFHSDVKFATSPLPAGAFGGSPPIVADFNGDGYADIARAFTSGPEFDGYVLVFINQKNNTFAPAETYGVGSVGDPTIAAADLNGDGRIDLAVLTVSDNAAGVPSSVGAFINTGSNTPGQRFQFVPNFWNIPAAFASPNDTLAFPTRADLNGDKLDDLVLGYNANDNSTASVLVLLNSAQASGRTVTEYKLPQVHIFGDESYDAGPMVVADFNGDGFQDVFINGGLNTAEYSHLSLALGNGKGSLDPWQSYDLENSSGATLGPTSAGDITGSGLPSVVVTDNFPSQGGGWGYHANYALSRGDGTFKVEFGTSQQFTPLAPVPTRVQVRDVNGDLKPDLVYLLAGGTGVDSVLVYLNVGTAPYYELSNPLVFPVAGGGYKADDFAAADVNNDGLLDLIVTGSPGGRLLLNQSTQNQPGQPVFLGAGAIKTGADFVNVQKPSRSAVHGQVYEDINRNGRRDTGETGTAGAVVFVDLNHNGRLDRREPSGTTIEQGLYAIPGVPNGKYPVVLAPEDAWRTPAAPVFVTVRDGLISRLDLGRTRRILPPIADQTATPGQTLTVPAAAAEAASGRVLRFTLEGRVPAGASIDSATGEFTWTPGRGQKPDVYQIAVRVRDPFDTTFTDVEEFAVRVREPSAVS